MPKKNVMWWSLSPVVITLSALGLYWNVNANDFQDVDIFGPTVEFRSVKISGSVEEGFWHEYIIAGTSTPDYTVRQETTGDRIEKQRAINLTPTEENL